MINELGVPYGVTYTPAGLLLVTDALFHRVILFDHRHRPVQKFGAGTGWGRVEPWAEPYRAWRAAAAAVGRERFAPVGGAADGELDVPIAIACGAHGLVALCDSGNHRVQLYV